ncbi:hypothetical protein AB5I41_28020 [Sphingomonas sp. MMS24-JH45]
MAFGTTARAISDVAGVATASAFQLSGNGSSGFNGGAGGASTLVNAVSGRTNGTFSWSQQAAAAAAVGRARSLDGSVGTAGTGGAGTSQLTFDDTANSTLSKVVRATSYAAGGASGPAATGGGVPGGAAKATVDVKGSGTTIYGSASADAGGAADNSAQGNGASGGLATASAKATNIAAGGSAEATAHHLPVDRRAVRPASRVDRRLPTRLSVGEGGNAMATVVQSGGAGAAGGANGYQGSGSGGAGGNATLSNATTGVANGGVLTLIQRAMGGNLVVARAPIPRPPPTSSALPGMRVRRCLSTSVKVRRRLSGSRGLCQRQPLSSRHAGLKR